MAAILVRTIGVGGRAETTWRAGERRCIYVPFFASEIGEVIGACCGSNGVRPDPLDDINLSSTTLSKEVRIGQ